MNGAPRTKPSSNASSLGATEKQTSQHEGPFNKGMCNRARRSPREGAISCLSRIGGGGCSGVESLKSKQEEEEERHSQLQEQPMPRPGGGKGHFQSIGIGQRN